MFYTEPLDRNYHERHGYGCKYETERQESSCVAPVADARHDKLGESVSDGIHREDYGELFSVESELLESWYCHGKILPDDVETGVSYEYAEKYLPSESFVAGVNARSCLLFLEGRGCEEIPHSV